MKKSVVLVVAFLAGILLTVVTGVMVVKLPLVQSTSESRNTQVINAISREQQVVLLSLGIQGISEKNEKSNFLGVEIPGSNRASFIQYGFKAKLGIEGGDVEVVKADENSYVVVIPEFTFVGHSDETFRLVTEDNGVLSWITPKIDSIDMINTILSDDAQAAYIDSNRETLQEQAEMFYTGIITSIDPNLSLRFEFRQVPR